MSRDSLTLAAQNRVAVAIRLYKLCLTSTPAVRASVGLVVVLLVGLGLRYYSLAARSFWFDEAFSWRLTEFPLSEIVQRVGNDNHPPLYFLLLKTWAVLFGVSEWSLRGLSVLLGEVTIIGTYLFTWEAFRRSDQTTEQTALRYRFALFAAAAVALSILQIRWSWEVRMYTLGTALAAFSSWALFRALHARPSTLRRWLLFGLLDLLFVYTHYYALFSIAAQVMFLVGLLLAQARGNLRSLRRDPRLWHALLAGCILGIGWLPWLPTFLAQRAQVREAFWTSPVRAWDVADACGRMIFAPENGRIATSEGLLATGVCVVVLLAVLWRAQAGAYYVFLAAVTPLVLSVLLSLAGTHVFNCRYLIFANLYFLTALGVVVGRIPLRMERSLLAGVILAGCLGIYLDFWRSLDVVHKPGARAATAHIDSKRRPGEPVIVSSPLYFLSLLYHTADRQDWYVLSHDHGLIHFEGAAVIAPGETIQEAKLDALQAKRVWAVDMTGGIWGDRAVPIRSGWNRRSELRFPEVYDLQGRLIVVEYEIDSGSANGQQELCEHSAVER